MEKDFRKVLREAQRQGWTIRETKNGMMLVPPEAGREIVTIHRTPSDRRAFDNFISRMRRSGYKE